MLDAGGGGGAGFAAGAAIGASMAAFAQSAASGGFAVNETGGQALLSAIRSMRDRLNEVQTDLSGASLQPPLGQSRGAAVMTEVDAAVANDGEGFMPMLSKFMESLDSAEQGIKDAMRNYAAMDERGSSRHQSA